MSLIGLDIGTSGVRAAAFDEKGKLLSVASEPLKLYTPKPGWAEQAPGDWWEAACVCLKKVTAEVKDVKAVGVAGQSWAMVLLDENGNVLCKTPIWMDQRAAPICENVMPTLKRRAFITGGNPLAPGYTTAKILWMRGECPDILDRTRHTLQSNSYIVYKMTGELSQDPSQGYGLHCYAMRSHTWDVSLANAFGVISSWLPPITPCAAVVGRVTEEASKICGLSVGTPVVAGGLDAACAALGAGVVSPGQTQEQGGQAAGMGVCLDAKGYTSDERLILSAHVLPGLWLLQGGTVGGGALRWLVENIDSGIAAEAEKSNASPYEVLCERAMKAPAGSGGVVFLPYLSGERSPIWDANAKGLFYGLDFGKNASHIARAAMEGVAYSLRHNIEVAEEAGASIGTLHSMGGASLSSFWTQVKADITQKPIRVPETAEATALGAAILAGVSQGVWKDGAEGAAATVRFSREYEPDAANREAYDHGYDVYKRLYPAVKGIG